MTIKDQSSYSHVILTPFKSKIVYIIGIVIAITNIIDIIYGSGRIQYRIINEMHIIVIAIVLLLFFTKRFNSNISIGIILYASVINLIISSLITPTVLADYATWFFRTSIIVCMIIGLIGFIIGKLHIIIVGTIYYLFYSYTLVHSRNQFLLNDIYMELTLTAGFFAGVYYIIMKIESQSMKLKQLVSTHDMMFTIIGHDLKSPFNTILGYSDLLVKNIKAYDIKKSEEFITIINSSSKRTLILLDNLLTWAGTQTGQINFTPEDLSLRHCVKEIADDMQSSATIKNILLNCLISEDVIVYADPNMLKTILRNLLANAIKFTNSGGKVDFYAVSKLNQIEITVSDNGIGMSEETKNGLFEIGTKSISSGTAKEIGSGLGLVLCNEFIKKHDGKIWAESELGKGSNFIFTLPVSKT